MPGPNPNGMVVLFIATSLDGYIARSNGDIDWLSVVQTPNEDYGYNEFIKTVGTVILGRKTYEKVLSFGIGFPHRGRTCYVLSRTPRAADDNVRFYDGDLADLVASIRKTSTGNIFVDGGAEVVHEFMRKDLIDRFVISVLPILLGEGVPLFRPGWNELPLVLRSSRAFSSGLVQNTYDRQPGRQR